MAWFIYVLCFCHLWGVYTIQQTFSKLPANVFKIHLLMLDVCWKFAGRLLDRVNTLLAPPTTVLWPPSLADSSKPAKCDITFQANNFLLSDKDENILSCDIRSHKASGRPIKRYHACSRVPLP